MITIIVPIYNAEPYLSSCLASLQAQTTKEPLRFVLVDDESTDGSKAIAQAMVDKDPRFKLYSQSHAGQSAARNLGMAHAKGEYIAFVDADDRLAPDWCDRHLKAIGNYDYVQSGYRRSSEKKDKSRELWWHVGRRRLPKSRFQYTSPCMRLYRKEALKKLHFEEGMIYEDVLFSVDLWCSGATCKKLRYAGYLYTRNPQSTTSRPHPEAQSRMLFALQERRKGQSLRNKLIITKTIFRLTLHFALL